MSAPSQDQIGQPAQVGRWQRFIDQLAGGPPNLEKLDKLKSKRWFVRYNVTLVMATFTFAGGIVPVIVTHLNGVPDPATLQTMQVRIVRTLPTEPHLFVELPDGTQRAMEWPVPISFHGGFRSSAWSDDERLRLPGCVATVRGAALRWTVNDRFRVWELDCQEKEFRIDFGKTMRSYGIWLESSVISIVVLSFFYFFIFVIYLREKRGNL